MYYSRLSFFFFFFPRFVYLRYYWLCRQLRDKHPHAYRSIFFEDTARFKCVSRSPTDLKCRNGRDCRATSTKSRYRRLYIQGRDNVVKLWSVIVIGNENIGTRLHVAVCASPAGVRYSTFSCSAWRPKIKKKKNISRSSRLVLSSPSLCGKPI